MRAAATALATISAVPFSAYPLVHITLFTLQLLSRDQVAIGGRSSVLAGEDACSGPSCGFSALQQRAKGTRASGAASRGGAVRRSASGGKRFFADLSLEELEAIAAKANFTSEELYDRPCEDLVDECEALYDRWWNCLDLDMSQVPRPPVRSGDPVQYLRKFCRKTCSYCGQRMHLKHTELRMIRNDEVDKELSYAREGGNMPEILQGIYWMDQRGFHTEGWKCDPDFHYNFQASAVNELLFASGDGAEWDHKNRCVRGSASTGRQGHWTYMNEGRVMGNSVFATNNYPNRMGGKFCQLDDEGIHWDIPTMTVPQSASEATAWNLLAKPDPHGFFEMPKWMMSFTMKKTCFGWSRKTTIGSEWMMPGGALYYPVFQIVDGKGRRTKHWDAYINFSSQVGTDCHPSAAGLCQLGDGMQFTPVMTKAEIPKTDAAYAAVDWLKSFESSTKLYDEGLLPNP